MIAHPDDVDLFSWVEGDLSAARAAEVERHVRECDVCQARQARHVQTARRLSDTLTRAAAGVPFAPARSWAQLTQRMHRARRTDRAAWVLRLTATAVITLLFVAGMLELGSFILRPQPAVEPDASPRPRVVVPTSVAPAVPTALPVVATPQPQAGRVTVLVAGVDRRPSEPLPGLTDSLMLFSLDRVRHTAVVLSIPRDLWVEIPGYGSGRINTAYALGEKKPGGGAALLKQTAGAALGIRVDHVVRVEFGAAVKLIDAVGGVEIDVPEAINDPLFPNSNYGYDPLYIPAGRQHMDGALALKYARTRHTSNDFDRASRQQQLLTALRVKLVQPSAWADLLKRAPDLFSAVQSAVSTDLSLGDVLDLAQQARDLPDGALRSAVLDGRYVVDYVTPDGAQVLLPLNDRVSAFVNGLFEIGQAPATPEIEMARVRLLNGTAQSGLASRTADWLRKQGYNVVAAENADRLDYAQTTLVDHAGRPATVRALSDLLKVAPGTLVYRPDPAAPAEVDVILGADFTLN